jgi:hypothetical protein
MTSVSAFFVPLSFHTNQMKKIVLLLTACLFVNAAIAQLTVNLTPSQDNSIYSESNNSNGTGALFSGYTCSGNARRALIQFDIAGSLPAGAIITSVTLTLNVMSTGGSATAETYDLYPLTEPWGEGTSFGTGIGGAPVFPDATWTDSELGTPWGVPGGTYGASSANAVLTDIMGPYNWSSAQMVTDVQNWLNTPSSNYGWILIGDETALCTARMFGSSEQGIDPVLSITYNCNNAPTAVCQNISVALDGNGNYILDPADLDGGSVAVCGGTLSFAASQTVFDCSNATAPPAGNLIITSVYDGPLAGGLPKGVELYVLNDIPDLSVYGIGAANNGGGTDGEEFSFPAAVVSAGSYLYIASEAIEFQNYFGFAPDYTSGFMAINGDDAIELFENGAVIDVFGDINVDGTGQPWDYEDGWASRDDATGPDGTTFSLANWSFSGPNALDGTTTNSTAGTPIPIGTYVTGGGIPLTLTVTDQFSNVATCNANITLFDMTGPDAQCIPPTTFNLDMAGNLTLTPVDIDNGTTDACGIASLMISQTNFTCLDLGLNAITLTATDIYGNTSTCTADVTIAQVGGLNITIDSVFHVTCYGYSDGAIYTTITGGSPPYVMDWDNDGTGDFDDFDDITGLSGGTYTLTVTDNNGCIAQVMVTIIEPAILDATLSPTDVSCFGEMDGSIDLTVTGGTSPYFFDWDNDGTGDTDDPEDLTGLSANVYEVMIIDDNGCNAIFNETIFDAVPVDISVTVSGFSLIANATGSTFQWVGCPVFGPVPGQTSATFNPSVDGDYAVIVTDGNGCSDTSACNTIFGIGITENTIAPFGIYPNPATHILTLVTTDFSGSFVITVSDASGRVVMRSTVFSANQVLDVSGLENGVYFIASAQDNDSSLTKFIISR